jgi:hypothetical protein
MSNFELLELLRQRTQEPGHQPRYPQPHDPFPTEVQVRLDVTRERCGCALSLTLLLKRSATTLSEGLRLASR